MLKGVKEDARTLGGLATELLEHAWWTREAWLEDAGKMGPPDKEAV